MNTYCYHSCFLILYYLQVPQSTDNKDADEKEGYANNTNRVSTVNPSISTAGEGFDNADDQERIDSSTQDVNTAGPSINTASENINTEPKKVIQALTDPSWIEAMQEELLQFKLQKVWTLVDLPKGKRAIGTKWVYRNKKDERVIVVRNKARLVAQGYAQEEGIDLRLGFCFLLQGNESNQRRWERVYVCQPPSFEDPHFLDKVYKYSSMYDDNIFGSTKKVFCVLNRADDAHEDSRLFYRTHTYSLDCKYNKGVVESSLSKISLWYPWDSPFNLEAFFDSDYARASLDTKSTTGGSQFFGKRLISWQCKKQTIVANSTTEADYVAAANCFGQVLWIQNQMLDYGFNFMNTKIYIDNESTICIMKNPVFHSKTKHIEIRHHFIRRSYEKKLVQVIKIHTDHNVVDLLTKAFDVSRFTFLIASIGLLN
ncbi:putative ribonuclease H-like domain-containing protein [Tanacetum coccineum]